MIPKMRRNTRYPVGTWRLCQQCRKFYTEAQPCPCRRTGHEEAMGRWQTRLGGLRVLVKLLEAFKRLRGWR